MAILTSQNEVPAKVRKAFEKHKSKNLSNFNTFVLVADDLQKVVDGMPGVYFTKGWCTEVIKAFTTKWEIKLSTT